MGLGRMGRDGEIYTVHPWNSVCGRFTIGEIKELMTRFSIGEPIADMPRPRFNVAPTQDTPVVIGRSPNRLVMMRFGLIPFWAKDERIGPRLINARAETVAEKAAFRASLKDRRCLVPTTGFYEWKRVGNDKVPYLFRLRDEKLFAMAGLYDRWRSPTGETISSFTIVTTGANEIVSQAHDRMPVVLRREDEALWLAPGPLEKEIGDRLFQAFPSDRMESYPVSRLVNDLRNDSEDLVRPLPRGQATKWF